MKRFTVLLAFLLCSTAHAQDVTPPAAAEPFVADTPAVTDVPPVADAQQASEQTEPEAAPVVAQKADEPETEAPIYKGAKVDDKVIALIREKIDTDLVVFMVKNQNEKYKGLGEDKIAALDAQWVGERDQDKKPLISATLSNPLSNYLTMVQAHSNGLFTEIFVMDDKGLNVGQSDISSDYWQGDEDKWQKTYQVGPETVFIDVPEFDDDKKVWISQTNVSLKDPETGAVIGAATFDVNLTELERRLNASAAL